MDGVRFLWSVQHGRHFHSSNIELHSRAVFLEYHYLCALDGHLKTKFKTVLFAIQIIWYHPDPAGLNIKCIVAMQFMYFTLCAQDVGGVKFAKLFMLAPGTFSFVSKEWWLYASGSYCRVPSNQSHHGRRPAILPPLERLPDQHGRLLQTSQRREKLLWCDDRNWGKQTFVKFGIDCTVFRVSIPRPTRWSCALARHTSRTCWSRTQQNTP